jgi:hypothetical protein
MSGKDALARRETARAPYPSFAKSPGGRRLFVLRMLRDRALQAPRQQAQNKAS